MENIAVKNGVIKVLKPFIRENKSKKMDEELAKEIKRGSILINLSGRGDKDMDYVIERYGIR